MPEMQHTAAVKHVGRRLPDTGHNNPGQTEVALLVCQLWVWRD